MDNGQAKGRAMRTAWKIFGLTLLVVLGLQAPAPTAFASSLSLDSLLRADGTLDLTRGASGGVDLRGWNVALDPKRGPVLSRVDAAPMTGETWSALPGHGLNGQVNALAL